MKFAALFLYAAAAFGQKPLDQQAVVVLANTPTALTVKQMTTVLRTVADVPDVSFDEAHSSFALRGWASQLGLAEWLLHAMDKLRVATLSAGIRRPSSREYHLQKRASRLWTDTRSPAFTTSPMQQPAGHTGDPLGPPAVGDIQQVYNCDEARS